MGPGSCLDFNADVGPDPDLGPGLGPDLDLDTGPGLGLAHHPTQILALDHTHTHSASPIKNAQAKCQVTLRQPMVCHCRTSPSTPLLGQHP